MALQMSLFGAQIDLGVPRAENNHKKNLHSIGGRGENITLK